MRNHPKLVTLLLVVICLSAMSALKTGSRISVSGRTNQMPQLAPGDAPVPHLDLLALTHDADVIVVGQVASVWDGGSATANTESPTTEGRSMIASLNVQKMIKGRIDGTVLSFDFFVPRKYSGYGKIGTSQFGMFFLRKNANGDYIVVDPYYPFVIASRSATVSEGTDMDRVIAELAGILTTPGSSPEERRTAVFFLDQTRTDAATNALRQAVRDKDTVVRLQAIAALLNRNDVSALGVAEDVLLHPSPNTDEYLRTNISIALEGIKDSRAIPNLKSLLKAGDLQTRRGAAAALRHIGTSEAIEPLLASLNDSDRAVRYQAVIGLAEITGQFEWGPSVDLFQKDEQRYLTYWREWAKTR